VPQIRNNPNNRYNTLRKHAKMIIMRRSVQASVIYLESS
jgi:hypothetical protein